VSEGQSPTQILAFCDEIWASEKFNYIYLSAILVEEENFSESANYILNARYYPIKYSSERDSILVERPVWQEAESKLAGEHFQKNNREVKFSQLTASVDMKNVASRWLETLSEIQKLENPPVRIGVLRLDMDNLRYDEFGDNQKSRDERIYRRFLRTNIDGAVNAFWDEANLKRVWHDRGSIEDKGHSLHLSDVVSNDCGVELISSGHRKRSDSKKFVAANFIQLADMIAGSLRTLQVGRCETGFKSRIAIQASDLFGEMGFSIRRSFPKYETELARAWGSERRSENNFYRGKLHVDKIESAINNHRLTEF
jgi:hypothetical protein